MTLKELRVWHWRQVIKMRQYAFSTERHERHPSDPRMRDKALSYHRHANLHLDAVKCLNALLPGTAEQDANSTNREPS